MIKNGEDWNGVRMGRRWEGEGEREGERGYLSFLDGSATSSVVEMKEMLESEREGEGIASSLFSASGSPHLSIPSFSELVSDCGKLKVTNN